MIIVVTGAQWGDEGKGKVVDILSAQAAMAVRYQGGANAGHTVVVGDKTYAFRLLPSGVLHTGLVCALGRGVAVDPSVLEKELAQAASGGFGLDGRLLISPLCVLVPPWYKELDGLEEDARGDRKIGTTRNGIGAAYADRAARRALRLGTALFEDGWEAAVTRFLAYHNILRRGYGLEDLRPDDLFSFLGACRDLMAPYAASVSAAVAGADRRGDLVIAEGAQGSLLDVDGGTLPYVTSSTTTAAGAPAGIGLGPRHFPRSLGIVKAYTTRVGNGPFPTEDFSAAGEILQQRGQEWGTVTGRKRRCGWLDGVLLRRAAQAGGYTGLILTKLDVLSAFESLPFCVGYRFKGKFQQSLPPLEGATEGLEPVYEPLEGWQSSLEGIRHFDDLPAPARAYILHIESYLGVPVVMISTGADRRDVIWRDEGVLPAH